MKTEFIIEHDTEGSGTLTEMYGALTGRIVDIELRGTNPGYPEHVAVLRIDPDGDVVVCELDDKGSPQMHSTFAVPQAEIFRVSIATGSFS